MAMQAFKVHWRIWETVWDKIDMKV